MSHARFLLFFVLAVMASTQAASAERRCVVEAIKGRSVEYRSGSKWIDLKAAALPHGATRIRTGPQTRLKITCDDAIVITIGRRTEVELSRLVGRSGSRVDTVLSLDNGILGVSAPHRTWRHFRVRTPLAIASVRSTDWIVTQTDAATAVFVDHGRVQVLAFGNHETLEAGQGADIRSNDTAITAETWAAERVSDTKARLGFAWQ